MNHEPVMRAAIALRDHLLDCAKEFRHIGTLARSKGKASAVELAENDAKVCDDAAAMMQKLGTEVTRLRLGIQHYHSGRMSLAELNKMTETWNDH